MKITSINRDTGRIYLYSHIYIYILYIDSHYFFLKKKVHFITNLNIAKDQTFKLTIVLKTV